MRSGKPSPRPSLPPKKHSSKKSIDRHALQSPKTTTTTNTMDAVSETEPAALETTSPTSNVFVRDSEGLDVMKRRMTEALAKKQEHLASNRTSPNTDDSQHSPKDGSHTKISPPFALGRLPKPESQNSIATTDVTLSTDSARTIRGPVDMTPGSVRTPSYPFPRVSSDMRLQRGFSSRSGPHHRPFTLLSPTNDPPPTGNILSQPNQHRPPSSEVSTPVGNTDDTRMLPDDPNYPTPDLYDMVLMLSTEPGLDNWWANATQILSEAYGAERASLALPGDVTDLENVPWGQRATFNIYGSDGVVSAFGSYALSSDAGSSVGALPSFTDSSYAPKRPPLVSRHSIAGQTPEKTGVASRQRPHGPTRATSTYTGLPGTAGEQDVPSIPRLAKKAPTPGTEPLMTPGITQVPHLHDVQGSATSTPRCLVHRALQPLEAEVDPLLVRTGVAGLFGKRKPVILTRAYSSEAASELSGSRDADDDQASFHPRDREDSAATIRGFEDYEQPEPSPWSQSPSPSPAARPDPAESPFFAQPAKVDEDAFASNPPFYDYGATANQSLSAIGADNAKTLVHIPLIQPVPSRNVLASGLRFPVAILSFLTPVTPFPANLRHSLTALLPHLASSFSLAQQYTTLQERLRGSTSRPGAAFGLGGTFSDEGSELELVTELSTQIQQDKALSKASSLNSSTYGSSERGNASKGSPSNSALVTPSLDQFGLTADFPSTPAGRSGAEIVDSYFSAKRNRSGQLTTSRAGAATSGSKASVEPSADGRRSERPSHSSTSRAILKKLNTTFEKPASENHPNVMRSSSIASESSLEQTSASRGDPRTSQLRFDDGERPLPELLAALMLNAVPLQLFLAKPDTGELVWTNRKFDAFRSQGEGRVRDPWKNVHPADRPALTTTWTEALKTGSQFTHYIRVKRFNSDSDYRWFVFRASTMLSNSGRLLYWVGSFLDVHEQYIKNLEAQEMEATMARDTKLRALADAIPQVLFEAVEGEGIVSVNQQWNTFSGQTLDEARGLGFARHVHRHDLHKCGMLNPGDVLRSFSDSPSSTSSLSSNKTVQQNKARTNSLFAPDDNALATMIRQGLMTTEQDENGRTSYTTEIRLRSKGGEFRWFLIRLVKVQNEAIRRGHASWYGTCTDIEVRMNLESELNAANKKVHQEMESKTKFFANMSHEIRTPLNGIIGSMPWLIESQLDHDQRRTLDTIQNSANNLRELVDNILDVTKVEAGKMTLLPKWFHVRSLCEEVVDTCSSRAIERGLELNYTLEQNVPSTVRGDPFRVRQVLLNLMGNAVKFTQTGEIYLRCCMKEIPQIHLEPTQALLSFEVVDTGRGFNDTEFTRLFTQFGQIEGASQHDAGSGLGLFLSKQLVEMHGGELSVSSKVGEGSTFSFFVRVDVTPKGTESASPEHPTSTRPNHRHSVSFGSSFTSSGNRTPTVNSSTTVVHTPGLSKYASPETPSPDILSPNILSPVTTTDGSVGSFHSEYINSTTPATTAVPTPESMVSSTVNRTPRPQPTSDSRAQLIPMLQRAQSDNQRIEIAHPSMYSIAVICPAEHARAAIKQHIQHVIPHQIPVNVTTLSSIGSFLDLRHGPSPPTFTHIVLDLPHSSDIMLFMRQMTTFNTPVLPSLVVITDHYQKRDIAEDFGQMLAKGRKAFLVHKPVKPSVFAMIFDPAQLRNLSKDRAREVAQSNSEDFKKIANQVKDAMSNKSLRLLLVEDSSTNRMVIQRYLKRVGLASDEAGDGQECVDKVLSHAHGYYNLIICDIQMPMKDGYQACSEIRQWEKANSYPPLPIMALTANAMPEERAAAGAAGFTDYLTKPVDFNRLGRMLITLLDPALPHTLLKDRGVDMKEELSV